jgi:hypothetical protein
MMYVILNQKRIVAQLEEWWIHNPPGKKLTGYNIDRHHDFFCFLPALENSMSTA